MRTLLLCAALAAACDPAGRPASAPPPAASGIYPDASTGAPAIDEPRLDLGDTPPIPDLPAEGTTGPGGETTGGIAETGSSSGSEGTAAGGESTSTGEVSSSSSTGGSSSTGEPPAPVCGDGVCAIGERSPCWGPKDAWCFADCAQDPACVSDCACSAGAAAVKNFCYSDPPLVCSATAPGGFCDPDGGAFSDVWGFYSWLYKCG